MISVAPYMGFWMVMNEIEHVLEIGTASGQVTRHLAETSNKCRLKATIHTVDPFAKDVHEDLRFDFENNVVTYTCQSNHAAVDIAWGYADMVIIDGAHKYNIALWELEKAKECEAKVIFLHDTRPPWARRDAEEYNGQGEHGYPPPVEGKAGVLTAVEDFCSKYDLEFKEYYNILPGITPHGFGVIHL